VSGAFVAAHRTVIDWLVQSARAYIYTTASPPAVAHAVSASLRLIRADEGERRRRHLAELVAAFRRGVPEALGDLLGTRGWRLAPSQTAIQPLIVGSSEQALAMSAALESKGLWVPAIRPPTVPSGSARLRITLSAAHGPGDVERLLSALAWAGKGI
jgi:8-amino-7-oxononanoate synthase